MGIAQNYSAPDGSTYRILRVTHSESLRSHNEGLGEEIARKYIGTSVGEEYFHTYFSDETMPNYMLEDSITNSRTCIS
jgi:hypothetical protein